MLRKYLLISSVGLRSSPIVLRHVDLSFLPANISLGKTDPLQCVLCLQGLIMRSSCCLSNCCLCTPLFPLFSSQRHAASSSASLTHECCLCLGQLCRRVSPRWCLYPYFNIIRSIVAWTYLLLTASADCSCSFRL